MVESSTENLLRQARDALRDGRGAEAETCCRQIIARDAEHPLAWQMLGLALAGQSKKSEAVDAFARAVAIRPSAESLYNLGKSLQEAGRRQEAIEAYRRALAIRPAYPQAQTNLAILLHESGQYEQAIAHYREVLRLQPGFAEAHYNLARALHDVQPVEEAIPVYREAIAIHPAYAQALSDLGSALALIGDVDEAIAVLSRAVAIQPNLAQAHNASGNVAKDIGQIDEALGHYRRAMSINHDVWAADNYFYALHFHPDFDAAQILEEHRQWNERYVRPLASAIKPCMNDRSPERRLRIGYVSPNLRRHPVGRFLLPLMENHDHGRFEIICYHGGIRRDSITERLEAASDTWRSSIGISDEELAAQIREDRIDILVNLTMHMEGSRLLTFARKPAPIQISYLAYCSTTGVQTIDYRITDPYLDQFHREDAGFPISNFRFPIEENSIGNRQSAIGDPQTDTLIAAAERETVAERGTVPLIADLPEYMEKSVWLPRCYWCYKPPAQAPDVASLPAASAGHLTFGSLNSFAKVSSLALEAWAQLLRRIPHSRLILHCPRGGHWRRLEEWFAEQGVEGGRIELVATMPIEKYFQLYHRIDIALDPFPYAGGTTTCDALWMGVPVVSLAGKTAVARGGLSILCNVGLAELVAHDVSQYISIAAALANNVSRLNTLRRTLRDRIRNSPLTDASGFARDVEAIYQTLWRNWVRNSRNV